MKLLKYTILELDPGNKNVTVEFTFDTEVVSQTIHFGRMHFNDKRTEDVVVKKRVYLKDKEGKHVQDSKGNFLTEVIEGIEQKVTDFVNNKPRLDLTSKESLHEDIIEYAEAFIAGRETENETREMVDSSSHLQELIGQVQEVA